MMAPPWQCSTSRPWASLFSKPPVSLPPLPACCVEPSTPCPLPQAREVAYAFLSCSGLKEKYAGHSHSLEICLFTDPAHFQRWNRPGRRASKEYAQVSSDQAPPVPAMQGGMNRGAFPPSLAAHASCDASLRLGWPHPRPAAACRSRKTLAGTPSRLWSNSSPAWQTMSGAPRCVACPWSGLAGRHRKGKGGGFRAWTGLESLPGFRCLA